MLVINEITSTYYSVHRANEYAVYLGFIEWDTYNKSWEFISDNLIINSQDLSQLEAFVEDLCDIIDESDSTD